MERALNVFGEALQCCCLQPKTGFYRDGHCHTGPDDTGSHVVCAVMTAQFLAFSLSRGNDLVSPRLIYEFPGLKPGDKWCLCVSRWKEAYEAGSAPPVVLEATNEKALQVVPIEALIEHAYKEQD